MSKYKNDFDKEHYDRIYILAPKGMKAEIKEAADLQDKSINAYVVEAVKEKIERGG